ncbi:MAG: hypothetical protein A2X35_09425 [Elusimicrobia bacterium GWA2_61_42]|nr:MAG: hypothetical protein A2X35_09425 [Elusimicrobia bacterium GWA2_61_42]OGR78305.1 MAG: hypothetical protein A2X38_00040 [Elusimicrobia bacterium GWC2_61_25]
MKNLLAITAAAVSLFAGRVSAAENPDLTYFTVDEKSIVIEEILDKGGTIPLNPGSGPTIPGPGDLPKPPSGPQINPPVTPGTPGASGTAVDPLAGFNNAITQVNGTVGAIDNIVNLIEKIWNIIEKNQPVVNITTNYANAVPFGTSHWSQLQGWNKPTTKKYSFSMKNGFGSEVVKVVYQVHYTYGGNFQGKGKFLTGVTVEPLNVVTAWGYKVTLVSEVPDSTIANVGTHEDPVASMQLQLRWTVHTAIKDITSKAIYYVQGDGLLKEIGSPTKDGMQIQAEKKIEAVTEKLSNVKFD